MNNEKRSEKRIVSVNWQHFSASFVCAILFPLLPLAIELFVSGNISDKSVLISSIMYCSAISLASDSVFVFVLGFLLSIVLSMAFGITFYNNQIAPDGSHAISFIAIIFFGFSHGVQRYNQHVIRGEDFIIFRQRDGEG